MESTAARIRRYREQTGLSQRALEARVDFSQSTITRIESGERPAKPYELTAIAAALGCPESSLLESHPLRDRVQYAARTNTSGTPDEEPVKDKLFYFLEMDNYLKRALRSIRTA
ncbi:helix-turn-helix domain-containing protein [Arthrobacter sp. VKM Ac-2550]|uniref:helix-turn-helix domain-containing protein n=1 Tax=Crystallibacter permensis TaxID=1938888 RepID=UPI002226132C|nr:helix-turn-helix transcriptional regulator [Arthrobacter sp. VKM Ac-2550]MCW2135020.1 Transcriptional regulator, contains XRE-family HTH domain [Arthrobacter sp. VKM Ac-2550]